MVKRVFYGEVANKKVAALKDLTRREFALLSVLVVLTLGIGVYPQVITEMTQATSSQFLNHMATSKLPQVGM
jgi:NADH-quinone oxidoreductase subunit M